MQVLSVSSLKGGVGKTTVALGLASAALNRGIATLFIDMDPQCDATNGLAAENEFGASIADVLVSPKLTTVKRAIGTSSWYSGKGAVFDVMHGSPRALTLDNPRPSMNDVWRLEEALSRIENDYQLVIIDTPPSINALTRTAWVASDRVVVVSEPSFFSVVAADRARTAIHEISSRLTPRLDLFGVVVNRLRPQSNEHEYRLRELREMFGERLLHPYFEERAAIQQATGAARPIHSWPAEGAAEIAKGFDWILNAALSDMERNQTKKNRGGVAGRAMRGQQIEDVIGLKEVPSEADADNSRSAKKRKRFGR